MLSQHSPYAVIFLETSYNRYSLAVLTGVLEEDERFEALDLHFVKFREDSPTTDLKRCCQQILELVNAYEKVCIALSFHTANVIEIAALIGSLRHELSSSHQEDVLLVAGGPHPSGDPTGTLQIGVDVVVFGEGEITFPALLERFFDHRPFTHLKGIRFFDAGGHYHYTGRPVPVNISDYPPFALRHKRFCPMEISRGCPYGCRFCQTSFLMGNKMRHRSLESIIKYAELTKHIGLRVLRFVTPSAFAYGSPDGHTVHLDALEALLQAVSAIYGKSEVYFGSFPSEVRPEQVTPETLELVKRYCANTNLVIGSQSGSERLLELLRRGHGVDEIVRAVELTIAAGLTPNIDFIFGLPGETLPDCQATIRLITRLTDMGARVHGHTFMPLPGTPLAESPPGTVDEETRQLMLRLRGTRQEHGRWQQQEQFARETVEFLNRQKGGS